MARNPEQITTKSGGSITKFRISVKKERRIKEGESRYSYFDCVAFDKTGDYVYKYANSQSRLNIMGCIEINQYTAKDGSTRYTPQIVVAKAEILSSTVNQGDFQQNQDDALAQYQEQPKGGGFVEVDNDEELPFL